MTPALSAFPAIETNRLQIRPLLPSDAEAVMMQADDPTITHAIHFLPTPFTISDASALVRNNDDNNCFLGAFQQGILIGIVGAHVHEGTRLEIGYWIGSKFQRQGYAREAVAAVIAELSRLYSRLPIIAECRIANEGSWSLLHNLGFKATGEKGARPGRELLSLR